MKKLIATLAITMATTASAATLPENQPFCLTAEAWDQLLEAGKANDTRMMQYLQDQQQCGVLKSAMEFTKLDEDEDGNDKVRVWLSNGTPMVLHTRIIE